MCTEPDDDFLEDDYDFNPECEKCGNETYWVDCDWCGGEGQEDGAGAEAEVDWLWHGDNMIRCRNCDGKGGWHVCNCNNDPH